VRSIGIVTVARSDYGIYRPVLRALEARGDARVILFAGGMHLELRFGDTAADIEGDGFEIDERVAFLGPDDSGLGVASSIGRGVAEFAAAFARRTPDLLVVLGDRFEMLAAAVAALPLRIPVAHIHGGELTEGAIDDAIRHAITKFSHLHFVSAEPHARRVRQLGEEPWRVVVSGAPALDALREFTPLPDGELRRRHGLAERPGLLVTFHPETLQPGATTDHAAEVLAAVESSDLRSVVTYPNADAGHARFIELVEEASARNERISLVRNLGAESYYTLMARADAMVGNSSSGLIEAPSLRLPVVNVGERQRGRLRAANVIDVPPDRESIAEGIARATSPAFRAGLADLENPYGDGHAAERIVERLLEVPLDDSLLVKRFHDLG
jgi:UDP-hydrolysing UDP-N-acetyl-D-glucosamine 2-epimerase